MNPNYVDTVRLLLAIARAVFSSGRFAMKGGTALNLFVQEMPRLSVDIDLMFVDHRADRQTALQTIAQELATVQSALAAKGYRVRVLERHATPGGRCGFWESEGFQFDTGPTLLLMTDYLRKVFADADELEDQSIKDSFDRGASFDAGRLLIRR